MKKIFTKIFWGIFITAAIWLINVVWYKPFDIDDFYERLLIQYALQNPESLTKSGILEQYGIKFHNSLLTPVPNLEERNTEVIRNLDMLMSYKRSEQNQNQLLSTEILKRELESYIVAYQYSKHDYPVNHLNGIHLNFPEFMISYHHIQTMYDAQQYLKRLSALGLKMQKTMEDLKAHQEVGVTPPNYVISKVCEQIERFKTQKVSDNLLYLDFANKIESASMIPKDAHSELLYDARSIISDVVYPHYDTLNMYFREISETASQDIGVWRFDDGEEYYTNQLRFYTNTDEFFAEDISERANREVSRIENKMRIITSQLAYPENLSIGEIMKQILENPDFRYPNSGQGIELCLKDLNIFYNRAYQEVGKYLTKPKAQLTFKKIPNYKENYAPLFNYKPIQLGSHKSAEFQVNLQNPTLFHKFLLPAMVAEELIPGRHLQSSIQREMNRPTFRKIISFQAYTDGWATYALYLAEENGFFKDPYHLLGRWHLELLKAVALQVDNGIHYKKWTYEEAVNFVRLKTGISEAEAVRLVDEVVIYPAKAWAYLVGLEKIKAARQRFNKKLQKKFGTQKFHELVLAEGAMPIDLLVQHLDNFMLKASPTKGKNQKAGVLDITK